MDDFIEEQKRLIEEKKCYEQFLKGQGFCIVCLHSDPRDLEYHHIGGKANSPLIVSLCRNCHGRISRLQRHWPKGWSNKNKPQWQKDSITIRGYLDLLRLITEHRLAQNE